MIENNKTEIVEEDENDEKESKRILTVGPIIIGSIIVLMIFCFIMIVVLDPEI